MRDELTANLRGDTGRVFLLPALLLLVTAVSLSPVLHNGFTTWDDPQYILENPLTGELSPGSIVAIFTTPEFAGNYHPLTLLLHAVEYAFFGTAPFGYHLVSLLLHLCATLLVYRCLLFLCGFRSVAFLAALLFGVHPMHVEPVAWAADQKDLLYVVFYLGGILAYLARERSGRRSLLWSGVLPLFLASLLSKGLAVTFPVVLLLVDRLGGRKIGWDAVREKIPLFLLSVVFGTVAILSQSAAGALTDLRYGGPAERILTAATGFVLYIVKLVIPYGLSPYYPYPAGSPDWHWLFVVAAAGIVASGFLLRKRFPSLFFGLGFFTITVLPVLQLLSVGNAMMADRYAYLPSIGIFFIAAMAVAGRISFSGERGHEDPGDTPRTGDTLFSRPTVAGFGAILYVLLLASASYTYLPVWNDGITLWGRVVELYPRHPKGYFNRGYAHHSFGHYHAAVADYDMTLTLDPRYRYGHFNRGTSKFALGLTEGALTDFNIELETIRTDPEIWYMRGTLFSSVSAHAAAISDFDSAVTLNPAHAGAFAGRGLSRTATGDLEGALRDYGEAIGLQGENADLFFNRGNILARLERYDEALSDYSTVLRFSPDDPDAWFRRGIVKNLGGDPVGACDDFRRAAGLNSPQARAALLEYCR